MTSTVSSSPLARGGVSDRNEQEVEHEVTLEEEPIEEAVDSTTSSSNNNNKDASSNKTAFRRIANRASVRSRIETLQPLELSFENLTVHVGKGSSLRKLSGDVQKQIGLAVDEQEPFYALYNVSGHVQTEEMVLVLSSDTQFSSTLVRALAGRLCAMDDLSGSVYLNGSPLLRPHWQRWRRVMAHVAATDASHAPNLTVRETFRFAAECTSPAQTPDDRLADAVQEVLEVLDLAHVATTFVGDENLRGISGGQKRRVTVGEMLFGDSKRFLGLENITDGLSSQDSYNLVERLRQACGIFKLGAVISLLQPSDEIVQLFDKLLVLDEGGGLAYFGPVDRESLREVFLGDEDNYSDDSGSICDLVLRRNNNSNGTAGDTTTAKQRFLNSPHYQQMKEHLVRAHTQKMPQEHSVLQYLPETKFASTWPHQVKIIGMRRLKLIKRNAATYMRICIAIVFGVVIGSLFSQLEENLVGSLSRTGYMFVNCFLTLMLAAAFTIPLTFRERVTLFKHRSSEFFSGQVAYVTQVLMDIPLSLLESALLSSISYFWVDMVQDASRFFYFFGILACLEMAGQAFARFLCSVSRKQVFATTMSSICILIFGTAAGFMPGFTDIPVYMRWLSWVTPASYAFEGVMINQFVDAQLAVGVGVPSGELDAEITYMEGTQWLANNSLPRKMWTSYQNIKIFDIFMILILALFFDALGCYFVERNREWYFNQIRRLQLKAISTHFQEKDKPKKEQPQEKEDQQQWRPSSLSVKDIAYFVPRTTGVRANIQRKFKPSRDDAAGQELQLLAGVNARFECGRMTALMGTSGAGKTTLLDVIAGYKTGGRITGEVMIDGLPKDARTWKYVSGYAEQSDILNPHLSAIETLRFTAACRLPGTVDRNAVIDKVVRLMELEDWTDMVVGREIDGEGLPKHARKRLTIAVQLVMQPKILFLDEPTTGLFSSAANLVMQAIRRVTTELNLITVATIHQPSKLIWDAFDDLLLLVTGGNVAYMGKMGENSGEVLEYFSELSGTEPPPQVNPADFVISAVTSVTAEEATTAFKKSQRSADLIDEIDAELSSTELKSLSQEAMKKLHSESRNKSGQNFFRKLFLLTKRHMITQWRDPSYSVMRFASSLLVSLYMGVLFSGARDPGISSAVFSIGAICFFVYILLIPMRAAIIPLVEDRAVLYRESMSGLYSRFTYGLGNLLADIPFHMANALVMFSCFYFLVGFRREADRIGYFILLIYMANNVIMSLGQLYGLVCPNEESAIGIAGLSHMLSVLLMGFLIMSHAIPDGWLWAYWANLFHYIMQGFVTNQLAGTQYLLIPPPTIPPLSNGTTEFLFDPELELLPGGVAEQSANLVNLATMAAPLANVGRNVSKEWAESGAVVLGQLVSCMMANDCMVEPVAENFVRCFIFDFRRKPPCKSQFDEAREVINPRDLFQCFAPVFNSTTAWNSTNIARGVPDDFTDDRFRDLSARDKLSVVLCLMAELLPPEFVSDTKTKMLELVENVRGVGTIVIDIVTNGIYLPGEVILWVFGWADLEDGKISADYKWFYCMFAVACFLVGIEFFKLFAIRFIVWTKR